MNCSSNKCSPELKNATDVDVGKWFDPITVNLLYVCARSLLLEFIFFSNLQ